MSFLKEHWTDDHAAPNCHQCNTMFTQVIRKHHCRLCGEVFCDKCSSHKVTVAEIGINKERACDACFNYQDKHLPHLLKEKHFTRFEKGGVTSSVWIRVSQDEKDLLIRYESTRGYPQELQLSTVQRIVDGQKTAVWESFNSGCCCFGSKNKASPSLCFSICFSGETVDLKADSQTTKQSFVEAFESFLAIRKSKTGDFIDEQRQKAKQNEEQAVMKERSEKQKLIADKYAGIRKNVHKKYNIK